jgi:hypothetical protein
MKHARGNENAYKMLLEKIKLEVRRPLQIPRRRRQDNIKVDLIEKICGSVGWI